jgi:glutathionylspermidine synthase
MERLAVTPRADWRETAEAHGFAFHSSDDVAYWDESACYRFTLAEIEDGLESPAEELEQMCFEIVERACADEAVLARLQIPEPFWDYVAGTWQGQEKNLYGRMDFGFDGTGPAKLYEYNADTPTSLYETAIFQWVWMEQAVERGIVPDGADQFNSLHEKLVEAFGRFGVEGILHLACARDSAEDLGTIEYLEDCARQGGLATQRMFVEEIGVSEDGWFTDPDDRAIATLFKLYPWEWLLREPFAEHIPGSNCRFIEPAWKSVLSNKGLLPLLWERFPGHPNLLPAVFEADAGAAGFDRPYVRKPIYSREGWNVEVVGVPGGAAPPAPADPGPYGGEGHVLQAWHPLPDFGGRRPMCGVWLVASQAAGLCIREGGGAVTTDDARFVPHYILD